MSHHYFYASFEISDVTIFFLSITIFASKLRTQYLYRKKWVFIKLKTFDTR